MPRMLRLSTSHSAAIAVIMLTSTSYPISILRDLIGQPKNTPHRRRMQNNDMPAECLCNAGVNSFNDAELPTCAPSLCSCMG